jgi:5-methylcytosine-specific restriction endonuclease McrA
MSHDPNKSPGGSTSWLERRRRRAGLYKLGLEMKDYETKYLLSPHWIAFRKLAFEAQRRRLGYNCCEHCPQEERSKEAKLQVHHLTYERLGSELLEDVIIICDGCHDKIHGRDVQNRKRHYAPGYRDLTFLD